MLFGDGSAAGVCYDSPEETLLAEVVASATIGHYFQDQLAQGRPGRNIVPRFTIDDGHGNLELVTFAGSRELSGDCLRQLCHGMRTWHLMQVDFGQAGALDPWVHHVAGEDCFLVKVRTRDTASLGSLLRDAIGSLPSVRSTRTTIVLETVKETMDLPIKPSQKEREA